MIGKLVAKFPPNFERSHGSGYVGAGNSETISPQRNNYFAAHPSIRPLSLACY
jgi:hypothetical protein